MANRPSASAALRSLARPKLPKALSGRGLFLLLGTVAILVGIWVGMGLAGYGLALAKIPGWTAANQRPGEVRSGRAIEVRHSVFDGGYRFKIQGLWINFFVPKAILGPEGMPASFQEGAMVGVKSTYQGVVLEMALNTGTPFVKQVAPWAGAEKYQKWVDAQHSKRVPYIVSGIVVALLPIIAFFILRRRLLAA